MINCTFLQYAIKNMAKFQGTLKYRLPHIVGKLRLSSFQWYQFRARESNFTKRGRMYTVKTYLAMRPLKVGFRYHLNKSRHASSSFLLMCAFTIHTALKRRHRYENFAKTARLRFKPTDPRTGAAYLVRLAEVTC